jgi:phenylacetate-CoA ligase
MQKEETLQALNRLLNLCKYSSFYRSRIPQEPLTRIEDFKNIPLTTKEDLRCQPPFGLVCIPRSRLSQYHETFGTTGTPVSSWFSNKDLQTEIEVLDTWGVDFGENDIVLNRFPYAISSAAHFVHIAAQARKACILPVSSRSTVSPFTRVVDMMKKLQVTVLAGLPLQALLIAETAEILGLHPDKDFPQLRAIATAGEPHPTQRRELLEQIWQVPVYDHYGMTETGPVAVQCKYGRYHVPADKFFIEILADDFKSTVPPGECGFIVITTLKREASPMLRYMTGDRARLLAEPCPCGAADCLEVRGRREDTIKTAHKQFDRWDLEELVSYLPCRRFWVAGPAAEGLHLVVEKELEQNQITPGMVENLEKRFNVPIKLELVPRGTLYDRNSLLEVGVVGKPRYIYTFDEMQSQAYLASVKV